MSEALPAVDGGFEAQPPSPDVLAPEICAEQQAHDNALLAKLSAFPRRNKINFAFGKFLLACKFYNADLRSVVQKEALESLFATAKAIASERQWRHPEGQGGWETVAWDTVTDKTAKYLHLTEEEIFEHIQNKKFWAWRWLFEAMIIFFRKPERDRKGLVRYYFAVRPDRRRKGQPVLDDGDDLTALERSESTEDDGDSIHLATDEGLATEDVQGFDPRISPVPDPMQTPDELKFDTSPEGEYEPQALDDGLSDGSILEPQHLSREQKRAILNQVDPGLLAFLDRLVQDEGFAKASLGKGLADFDQGKLRKVSTLLRRGYGQSRGLSQRTIERRIEKIRKFAAKRKISCRNLPWRADSYLKGGKKGCRRPVYLRRAVSCPPASLPTPPL